jgi:flagellar biosynthesis chaperone FliJ
VQQILNGTNSNWQGRANKIAILQNKVAELRQKCEQMSDYETFYNNNINSPSQTSLKRLESVRRMEVENLTQELDRCKSELHDTKQKLASLKARHKNILEDLNSYKLKTLDLMEKSKNDDEFIKCMNEKINILNYELEHKLGEWKREENKMKHDFEVSNKKLECDVENLKDLIEEKDNEISNLKNINQEMEQNVRNVSGDFLFSCRNMSISDFSQMMDALKLEKNELLSMVQELSERLNKQVIIENEQHDLATKQKIKIARLEAKIKEYENEKETAKVKNRRSIRINEYCGNLRSPTPAIKSCGKFTAEIDRLKFK